MATNRWEWRAAEHLVSPAERMRLAAVSVSATISARAPIRSAASVHFRPPPNPSDTLARERSIKATAQTQSRTVCTSETSAQQAAPTRLAALARSRSPVSNPSATWATDPSIKAAAQTPLILEATSISDTTVGPPAITPLATLPQLSVGGSEFVGYDGGSGTFSQSSGTNSVHDTLTVGPMGSFTLGGGALSADSIVNEGVLTINGGTLAIGAVTLSPGGTLNLGLLGPAQFGALTAVGNIDLNGTLRVSLLDYAPSLGASFHILNWGTLSGTFASLQLPALTGGLTWNTSQLYVTGTLSVGGVLGDYNSNGIVDAADYTLWRDSLGSTTNLAADGNGNGVIDSGDFDVWKANYGNHSGSGAGETAAVPEPMTLWMLLTGILAICCRRRPKVS